MTEDWNYKNFYIPCNLINNNNEKKTSPLPSLKPNLFNSSTLRALDKVSSERCYTTKSKITMPKSISTRISNKSENSRKCN